MSDVGIVIVGAAGDRGAAALEILPKLHAIERSQGINVELVCLAEANEASRAALASRAAALSGASCPVVSMLAEAIPHALRWLATGATPRKLLVYDATPTAHHYLHLMTVLPHSEADRIYYFGEKPLFTKQGQVNFVERTFPGRTFFCEFIETENPAVRAAREFLRSERLHLQRMSFWRASCMGVSIAAGDGRGGVEGGALLDKAPHDLSVAVSLLNARHILQWSVRDVHPHLLALHESALLLGTRNFLSVANTPLEDISRPPTIPEHWPASALASFDLDLTLQGGSVVPVSCIASWLGIQETAPERRFRDKLTSLGITAQEWLNTEEPQVSTDRHYRYENQEARVALLEGLSAGGKVYLVLNLLAKFAGRRFVYLIDESHRREVIFAENGGQNYHRQKDADLLRVFLRVVEHCAGHSHADNVGPEATLLVHGIMLRALEQANEQLSAMDQDQAFSASLLAYRKYLAPVASSRHRVSG